MPGAHLHDEQRVQASEEDRVDLKEIAGQQAISLCAQERPPGGVRVPRSRPATPGAQDPPHRRHADAVTEPAQLTMHPAAASHGVLPRQSQHQGADLRAGARTTRPIRVRPPACDQAAVPSGGARRSTTGSCGPPTLAMPRRPPGTPFREASATGRSGRRRDRIRGGQRDVPGQPADRCGRRARRGGSRPGCDFVKSFGLPGDAVHAARHLAGHAVRCIDIGQVTFCAAGRR